MKDLIKQKQIIAIKDIKFKSPLSRKNPDYLKSEKYFLKVYLI